MHIMEVTMSLTDDLTDMIRPVVLEQNYRLWDLKLTKAGKRTVVTITLDKDGGATLDEIADISKLVAPLLDEHPTLDDAYHLEVASPGLERALTKPEHYEWSIDMNVAVSHRVDGTLTRTRGKLVSVETDTISVETDNDTVSIPLDSITKAHTLFDYEAAMKRSKEVEDQAPADFATQGETA
jgi:ribosome maturation factor RimP